MGAPVAKSPDVEQERQQRIGEMASELGPTWTEQYRPGSFGCHELLDRTSLAADTVEQYILSHPACLQNAEWYALAEQAAAALRRVVPARRRRAYDER